MRWTGRTFAISMVVGALWLACGQEPATCPENLSIDLANAILAVDNRRDPVAAPDRGVYGGAMPVQPRTPQGVLELTARAADRVPAHARHDPPRLRALRLLADRDADVRAHRRAAHQDGRRDREAGLLRAVDRRARAGRASRSSRCASISRCRSRATSPSTSTSSTFRSGATRSSACIAASARRRAAIREFYQCDIDVIGKDTLSIAYDGELPARDLRRVRRARVRQVHDLHQQPQAAARAARGRWRIDDSTTTCSTRSIACARSAATRSKSAGRGDHRRRADANALLDVLTQRLAGRGRAARCDDNATCAKASTSSARLRRHARARRARRRPIKIDLSIVRGLDYYTGTVYETFLDDHPEYGSICSGGRYDNLAGLYTKSKLPGVGISIGVTRLFAQLLEAEKAAAKASGKRCASRDGQAIVLNVDAALAARVRRSSPPSCARPGSTSRSTAATTSSASSSSTPTRRRPARDLSARASRRGHREDQGPADHSS